MKYLHADYHIITCQRASQQFMYILHVQSHGYPIQDAVNIAESYVSSQYTFFIAQMFDNWKSNDPYTYNRSFVMTSGWLQSWHFFKLIIMNMRWRTTNKSEAEDETEPHIHLIYWSWICTVPVRPHCLQWFKMILTSN